MSFADYGFEVFTYKSQNRQFAQKSSSAWNGDRVDESSCHSIIGHLIGFSIKAENKLQQTCKTFEKYRCLDFTEDHPEDFEKLEDVSTKIETESLSKSSEFDSENLSLFSHTLATIPECDSPELINDDDDISDSYLTQNRPERRDIFDKRIPKSRQDVGVLVNFDNNSENICIDDSSNNSGSRPLAGQCKYSSSDAASDVTFRETILLKESQIDSLKNETAAKESEMRLLEKQNSDLEMIVEKMKQDMELLESSSKVCEKQIQDIVQQKNAELQVMKDYSENLEMKLRKEQEYRLADVQDKTELDTIAREAIAHRKAIVDELKMMKCRVENLENSNASRAALAKKLQLERDALYKQSSEQEAEIDRLLGIVKRLTESKHELMNARANVEKRELAVAQCHVHFESMELEVSKLIGDLSECLGRGDAAPRPGESALHLYAHAKGLARDLGNIVREHDKCASRQQRLLAEIERLEKLSRAQEADRQSVDSQEMCLGGSQEGSRRALSDPEKSRRVKTELRAIVDNIVVGVEHRSSESIERTEQAYMEIASEASLALQKLDENISEHEVYNKCQSYLLLELENLQQALDGAEKTIMSTLALDVGTLACDVPERNEPTVVSENEENNDTMVKRSYSSQLLGFDNGLSRKILERVQNSTKIVIRITTALHDESKLKQTYNRNLDMQLQQTMNSLSEVSLEKCKLQNEYNSSQEQVRNLTVELEQVKGILVEKSNDLQSRLEDYETKSENLRNELIAMESKNKDILAENSSVIKKHEGTIESLQQELQKKILKLQEYGTFNEFLNAKLNESNNVVIELQKKIVEEATQKVNLDSLTSHHNRILELVNEKNKLSDHIIMLKGQLTALVKGNSKLQNNLVSVQRDNENLDKSIKTCQSENERLQSSIADQSGGNINLLTKCDQVLEKMNKIARYSKICQTPSLFSINEEAKRYQALLKENNELKKELAQTSEKYEGKLVEMHKQYKVSEAELLKNHNESIERLKVKYEEMVKADKDGSFSSPLHRNYEHSASERGRKLPGSPHREVADSQKKRVVKSSSENYGSPVASSPSKKEFRAVKSTSVCPAAVRGSLRPASRTVHAAEKEFPQRSPHESYHKGRH